MDNLRYWVGFNRAKGIGPTRLRMLIDFFGDIATAWNAPASALRSTGLDARTLTSLLHTREKCNLDEELRAIERAGAWTVLYRDPEYPALLRQIEDAPPLLYVRGTLSGDDVPVAVVGTRKATTYGKAMARKIVEPLAAQGYTIVSGLAVGIDAVAHRAALDAGGRTIAVLPSGIDRVYPPEHRALAEEIAERGALITEFPLGEPPDRLNFAPRNRLVSGLALGVVVIEASEKSGALITADLALKQGREVFAVPGNVSSPTSAGTNNLIREGANVVTDAADILDILRLPVRPAERRERVARDLPPAPSPEPPPQVYDPESPLEATLLRCLMDGAHHIDDLSQCAGVPVDQAASALMVLELNGAVRQVGPMVYALADSAF